MISGSARYAVTPANRTNAALKRNTSSAGGFVGGPVMYASATDDAVKRREKRISVSLTDVIASA